MLKNTTISSTAFVAKNSMVLGDVTIGDEASVFFYAVLRGDEAPISIGNRTNIQENCTIHVDADAPVCIGNDVTIGHNSVIHGCQLGDRTLVGMGSIIMNHAVIGADCLIAAGSLITQGTVVPDGMLVMGSPAKVKRPLTEDELKSLTASSRTYTKLSQNLKKEGF